MIGGGDDQTWELSYDIGFKPDPKCVILKKWNTEKYFGIISILDGKEKIKKLSYNKKGNVINCEYGY